MFKYLFLVFVVFSGCSLGYSHDVNLKNVEASGTDPRLEREYKYTINDPNGHDSVELANLINEALSISVKDNSLWQVPDLIGANYNTDMEAIPYAYFDIYFDTEDRLNLENAISYRLRERFNSFDEIFKHIEKQDKKKYLPYRIEFQSKVGREELGEGFSQVMESRFEFRVESDPFSEFNPPPSAPWDLDEFMVYFESGKYKQYYTWPAKAIVDYLMPKFTDKTKLYFKPVLIIITERTRQHFNIKSDFGSGPNPEQSFIISLDTSHVYEAGEFLNFIKKSRIGNKVKLPSEKGVFSEIEIEFERNVSSVLDDKILAGESNENSIDLQKLLKIRDAFLVDQKTIMTEIVNYFNDLGITIKAANKSKYLEAYQYL